jgi:hypothetical protein
MGYRNNTMTLISSPLEIQKSLRTENRIPSIRFLSLSLVFLISLLPVFIKGNGNQREYGGPHLGRHVLAVFEELERMLGTVRHKNKIILHEKPYRRENAPGYQQDIFFVRLVLSLDNLHKVTARAIRPNHMNA